MDLSFGNINVLRKLKRFMSCFVTDYGFLSQNTCDFLALGECGRLPLCTTYILNCVKYWLSIIRTNNVRYPKQCYYMLLQLDEAGRTNWTTHIKNLLFSYGFGHVWIFHDVGDDKEFLRIF